MRKTQLFATAALALALGLPVLGGCAGEASEAKATYNPGEPPLMTASHQGRFERLGAKGCYGCHGSSESAEVLLAAAPALPADHYAGADVSTREIDGPRAECLTCHPIAGE